MTQKLARQGRGPSGVHAPIGRSGEINAFSRNLIHPDDPKVRIFYLWGESGIGKTYLVRAYRTMAQRAGLLSALTDESDQTSLPGHSVLMAMAHIANEMRQGGAPLEEFDDQYDLYLQWLDWLQAQEKDRSGSLELLLPAVASSLILAATLIPHEGAVLVQPGNAGIDPDQGATARAWETYVDRKIDDEHGAALVKDPVSILTPIFARELSNWAQRQPIVLCFDSWESTGEHLEHWLLNLLERYLTNERIWLVIAGENSPGDVWAGQRQWMASFKLQPFTESETRKCLADEQLLPQPITDRAQVAEIHNLADGLPLLVMMLGSVGKGTATTAAGTSVERYLQRLEEDERREVVPWVAVTRQFDEDVIEVLLTALGHSSPPGTAAAASADETAVDGHLGQTDGQRLLRWLVDQPYVSAGRTAYRYHPRVRRLMLDHAALASTPCAVSIAAGLAGYHRKMAEEQGAPPRYTDPVWWNNWLEALYHELHLPEAEVVVTGLETFLTALSRRYEFAGEVARLWNQAAEEPSVSHEVQRMGKLVARAWKAIQAGQWDDWITFRETVPHDKLNADSRLPLYRVSGLAYAHRDRYAESIADYSSAISLNSQGAVMYNNRGYAYACTGQTTKAIADFTRAIKHDPRLAAAYNNRGIAHCIQGNHAKALTDLTRATELDPHLAIAHNNRGLAYAVRGQAAEALEDVTHAIEIAPHLAVAHNTRGSLYATLRQATRAIADYTHAIELAPQDATAYRNRATVYHELQQYLKEIEDYDRAIVLEPEVAASYNLRGLAHAYDAQMLEAIADYTRAIEIDQASITAYNHRGNAYCKLKRYAEAIADYTRAIQLDPRFAVALNNRGYAYACQSQVAAAIADYTDAIAIDSHLTAAYRNRGNAYATQAQTTAAIADYTSAIALDPHDGWTYANRGLCYAARADYPEAIVDFSRAIELNPQGVDAYTNRGRAHDALGQYTEAVADFSRAIALEPRHAAAYIDRGTVYRKLLQYTEAIADYTRAIELEPQNAAGYRNRGDAICEARQALDEVAAYAQTIGPEARTSPASGNRPIINTGPSQVADAVSDYTRAIQINPQDASTYRLRGDAYQMLAQTAEALADYDHAIEIDPHNAAALNSRGHALAGQAKFKEAIADFTRAIELDPRFAAAYHNRGNAHAALHADHGGDRGLHPRDRYRAVERRSPS